MIPVKMEHVPLMSFYAFLFLFIKKLVQISINFNKHGYTYLNLINSK